MDFQTLEAFASVVDTVRLRREATDGSTDLVVDAASDPDVRVDYIEREAGDSVVQVWKLPSSDGWTGPTPRAPIDDWSVDQRLGEGKLLTELRLEQQGSKIASVCFQGPSASWDPIKRVALGRGLSEEEHLIDAYLAAQVDGAEDAGGGATTADDSFVGLADLTHDRIEVDWPSVLADDGTPWYLELCLAIAHGPAKHGSNVFVEVELLTYDPRAHKRTVGYDSVRVRPTVARCIDPDDDRAELSSERETYIRRLPERNAALGHYHGGTADSVVIGATVAYRKFGTTESGGDQAGEYVAPPYVTLSKDADTVSIPGGDAVRNSGQTEADWR